MNKKDKVLFDFKAFVEDIFSLELKKNNDPHRICFESQNSVYKVEIYLQNNFKPFEKYIIVDIHDNWYHRENKPSIYEIKLDPFTDIGIKTDILSLFLSFFRNFKNNESHKNNIEKIYAYYFENNENVTKRYMVKEKLNNF